MPWTANDAPSHTKKANTAAKKKKWASIANDALKACLKAGGSQKECEGRAIRIANSKLEEGIMAWTEEDIKHHDEYFGVTEERKKAGGSNVGKYKKGPFCGPAGGAPKGTYPVDTKKRAIAALAYARHAPNPAGIKKCVCSHWSSLPACKTSKKAKKKMEEDTQTTVPTGALHFKDENCFAKITTGEDDKEQLDMVIYSGGLIREHWYWDNLIIDLAGMSFPKKKYPILESHSTDRKIGFSGKPSINGNLKINPDTVTFVDTEASLEFRKLSKEGFPYESSMYAKPTVIERVSEGASVKVNGTTVKGPATVWRKSIFKEASVCVFGYDSDTRAAAFADEIELNVEEVNCPECDQDETEEGEVNNMTLDELKEKHPELFGEITDGIREEVTTKVTTELTETFNQEKKDLEDKNKGLEKKIKDQTKANESLDEKVLTLEKAETIRSENDLKRDGLAIWAEELGDSDIPKEMYGKVLRQVSHRKFVKDGVLDTEAFTTAVKAEIADWEKKGVTSTVIGVGFSTKDVETEETKKLKDEDKDDDDAVQEMLELSGDVAASKANKEVKNDA